MFDIKQFYRQAHDGEKVDSTALIKYIKGFENLIIWGAGNLGAVIGKKFNDLGIDVTCYWDIRAKDIIEVNDTKVIEPFSNNYEIKNTIIIVCVTNVFCLPDLEQRLTNKKITYILGFELFQGLMCGLNSENFDTNICCKSPFCNVCNCERLFNISKQVNKINNKPIFDSLVFPITQKCSLNCKFCSVFMNSYTPEKCINFPLERIEEDIDRFCDSSSFIARAVVYGGEPFLHPDIDKIIKKLSEKKNVGIISIATNGIFRISQEKLKNLHCDNLRIDFSNYSQVITAEQRNIVNMNYELFKSEGIRVNMSNVCPEWIIPGSLKKMNLTIDALIDKKAECFKTRQECSVKNGRFFPCTRCDSVYNLGIKDYFTDYVNIDASNSSSELTSKIQECLQKKYYGACDHCGELKITSSAAEQGYFDFIGEK
jgi:organic radical activating enzyme